MTSGSNDEDQEQQLVPAAIAPADDWMLVDLVALVNQLPDSDLEIGITLWTTAGMVSGRLISGFRYFDLLKDSLHIDTTGMDEEEAAQYRGRNSFADYFGNYKNIYAADGPANKATEEDDEQPPRPGFIHLRGVKFGPNFPAPSPGDDEVFWRGRLTEVSGWSLSQVGGGVKPIF